MALFSNAAELASMVAGNSAFVNAAKQGPQSSALHSRIHIRSDKFEVKVNCRSRHVQHATTSESKAVSYQGLRSEKWRCRAVSEKSQTESIKVEAECGHSTPSVDTRTGQPESEEQVKVAETDGGESFLANNRLESSLQYDLQTLQVLEAWLVSQGVTQIGQERDQNGARTQGDLVGNSLSASDGWDASTAEEGNWWSRLYNRISPRVRGLLLLNLLTLLYGSNIAVIKEAEELLNPAAFSTGRFAIAALVFLPFVGAALKEKTVRSAGLELGLWGALGYLSQAIGVTATDAGRASFISTFTVIEVPIIAGLFGAKIPNVTWVSAAAAVCGVGLLETTGGHSSLVGDTWTFLSALFFGVHMLRSEHHSKHLSHNAAVPLISLQLATMTLCSGLWWSVSQTAAGDFGLLQSAMAGDWSTVGAAASDVPWFPLVYTGLLSTALCLWIEVVSLRDVSATEAAMVYTVEPLYGAGFAWVLLGERWGLKGWLGAALILGGSLAMQIFGKESEEEEEEEEEAAKTARKPSAKAAAAVLAAAAVATALAAAATPRGGFAADEAAQQAALLADSVDLDNFANILRIYAMTRMDADREDWTQ